MGGAARVHHNTQIPLITTKGEPVRTRPGCGTSSIDCRALAKRDTRTCDDPPGPTVVADGRGRGSTLTGTHLMRISFYPNWLMRPYI